MSDRKQKQRGGREGDIEKEPVRRCNTFSNQGLFHLFFFFFFTPLNSHLGSQLPPGSDDYRAAEQAAALPAQRHERSRTPGGRQSGHPRQRSER